MSYGIMKTRPEGIEISQMQCKNVLRFAHA